MRVDIKTQSKIWDKDVKALFVIGYALNLCSKRMVVPTLEFFADRIGYKLVKK